MRIRRLPQRYTPNQINWHYPFKKTFPFIASILFVNKKTIYLDFFKFMLHCKEKHVLPPCFYWIHAHHMNHPSRIIIGITSASGAIYGITLLKALQSTDIHTHLIISKNAAITIKLETGMSTEEVAALADETHPAQDIAACLSSGSYRTLGMIIAPCSIRTMAEIATSTTSSLLTRAADVALKEKRLLTLMVRETPLHAGHLEHMHKLALMGAVIAPPVPAFYSNPTCLQDIVDHTCARVLDLYNIESESLRLQRWKS